MADPVTAGILERQLSRRPSSTTRSSDQVQGAQRLERTQSPRGPETTAARPRPMGQEPGPGPNSPGFQSHTGPNRRPRTSQRPRPGRLHDLARTRREPLSPTSTGVDEGHGRLSLIDWAVASNATATTSSSPIPPRTSKRLTARSASASSRPTATTIGPRVITTEPSGPGRRRSPNLLGVALQRPQPTRTLHRGREGRPSRCERRTSQPGKSTASTPGTQAANRWPSSKTPGTYTRVTARVGPDQAK